MIEIYPPLFQQIDIIENKWVEMVMEITKRIKRDTGINWDPGDIQVGSVKSTVIKAIDTQNLGTSTTKGQYSILT